jgi:hypothetical protein
MELQPKEVYAIEVYKMSKEQFEWTGEKIKGAFNFGHGTLKDLKRYMDDNKKYCQYVLLKSFAR